MEVRLRRASEKRPLRTALRRVGGRQRFAVALTRGQLWAEHVSGRYGFGRGRWEGAPFTHRRVAGKAAGDSAPGTATSLHLSQTWPLYLTLKLAVPTVLRVVRPPQSEQAASGAILPPAQAGAQAIVLASAGRSIETVLTRLAKQETWATNRVEQGLFERILARARPPEDLNMPSQVPRQNPWEDIPVPQRVVSQPPVATPVQQATTQSQRQPGLQYWDTSQAEQAQPRLTLDSIDVNGLTDRVLRTLDERIVSERERFGKR